MENNNDKITDRDEMIKQLLVGTFNEATCVVEKNVSK